MSITPLPPRPTTLPALARPVPLSPSLADHARGDLRFGGGAFTPEQRDTHPHLVPHLSPPVGSPSRANVAEAVQKLTEAEHACHPASRQTIVAWCLRIVDLPWHPTDERLSKASIAAICLACADLPVAVWTVETAALALRTFKRWPGPAEVYDLLNEQARPFLRIRDGLRRVAEKADQPPPAPLPERTQAAQDAVRVVVKAFEAERMYHRSGPTPDEAKPKPAPLSPGAILAVWEQAAKNGVPGADIRLAMLRKQNPDRTQEA